MKSTNRTRYGLLVLFSLLIASGCNMGAPTAEVAPVLNTAAPPADTPTPPFVGAIPVALPAERADQAGDVDSSPNAMKKRVSGGDVFVRGLYERPFNAKTMDTYFPYVDIVGAQGFRDDTWGYATITLANTDSNGGLPAQYGIELDLDKDGRGDWLILASSVAGTEWSTKGVQALQDSDQDVGGAAIMAADSHRRGGNGYEDLVFDQGQGSITDGAWSRISAGDPKTVEIAFKLDMMGSPKAYAMGAWAGTTVIPRLFDYNDSMTHLQAGSPNPGYEVYPLADMAEIDNTCRLAVGFAPTGKEPGLCASIQEKEAEGGDCIEYCFATGKEVVCICR